MKRFLYLIRYIRLLKKNKKVLEESRINKNVWGIYYDWIYRLYTVLVLPFEDKENIAKYGIYYVDNMVKQHVAQMNEYLFNLGLLEYLTIDAENVEQIAEFNFKIVLKFKFLNLKKIANFLIVFIPLLITLGIFSIFIF